MIARGLAAPTTAGVVGSRPAFRGTAVKAPSAVPRRTGRAASVAVSARATTAKQSYICVDCGYIYDDSEGPFAKLPNSYRCPVCTSPKRRFKPYAGSGRNDPKSMNARWKALQNGDDVVEATEKSNTGLLVGLGVGVAGLAALYAFLSSQYN